MYLIVIGWIYDVTLLMGVMEASSRTGTVWGGIATFVLYGQAQATSDEPDTGRKAPAAAQCERVAPVRKEP